ncbi:dCTP deaminase/dUTPase family protein [Enterococcus hermanniensis]|uniref:dUTP diphosphatase n=1 Tax=Enterococcus hermanniensis TaxID=249189 RepID=A0A1L8TGD0_9ENTE|nr:dUTP diphosphatase [Enterococcus hermanniensis]OJG43316.1 dUTP diphosphatase [Enterococcus hermanniensis]
MKRRGFEVVAAYKEQAINLPRRATKNAAGYDFEAAADIVIPAVWKQVIQHFTKGEEMTEKVLKPVLVPTGIKAYMAADEYLQLANRSSNPLKRFITLSNGIGVIDSDYYNNPDNEGHIMFQFSNFGLTDVTIKKGERIGQGIFLPFLKADNDQADTERTGGFGSSGKQ